MDPGAFAHRFLAAAQSTGRRLFPDPNGAMMEADGGCAFVDETVVGTARRSIFRSYVRPMMDRPNLTVLTGALVERIGFDGGRASRVEFDCGGKRFCVKTNAEIVLSLGAINTPKLLMLSGVGDSDDLAQLDIPVIQHLPGVGRGLHDHVPFGCVWQNGAERPPAIPRSQVVSFWESRPDLDSPNFYSSRSRARSSRHRTRATSRCRRIAGRWWSECATSRGHVWLATTRPTDAPIVDANYLEDPQDMTDLLAGLEMARAIGNAGALKDFRGAEVAPGELARARAEQFFRNGLTTFWHQSGTARMGTDEDAVVDGSLAVHGVSGLRIADSSIMPRVTTGNTMAPCVVIGELTSEFIAQARR